MKNPRCPICDNELSLPERHDDADMFFSCPFCDEELRLGVFLSDDDSDDSSIGRTGSGFDDLNVDELSLDELAPAEMSDEAADDLDNDLADDDDAFVLASDEPAVSISPDSDDDDGDSSTVPFSSMHRVVSEDEELDALEIDEEVGGLHEEAELLLDAASAREASLRVTEDVEFDEEEFDLDILGVAEDPASASDDAERKVFASDANALGDVGDAEEEEFAELMAESPDPDDDDLLEFEDIASDDEGTGWGEEFEAVLDSTEESAAGGIRAAVDTVGDVAETAGDFYEDVSESASDIAEDAADVIGDMPKELMGGAAAMAGGMFGEEESLPRRSSAAPDVRLQPLDPNVANLRPGGTAVKSKESIKPFDVVRDGSQGRMGGAAESRRGSFLVDFLKVVVGGILGLSIAQMLLWWLFQADPIGIAMNLPKEYSFILPPSMTSDQRVTASARSDVQQRLLQRESQGFADTDGELAVDDTDGANTSSDEELDEAADTDGFGSETTAEPPARVLADDTTTDAADDLSPGLAGGRDASMPDMTAEDDGSTASDDRLSSDDEIANDGEFPSNGEFASDDEFGSDDAVPGDETAVNRDPGLVADSDFPSDMAGDTDFPADENGSSPPVAMPAESDMTDRDFPAETGSPTDAAELDDFPGLADTSPANDEGATADPMIENDMLDDISGLLGEADSAAPASIFDGFGPVSGVSFNANDVSSAVADAKTAARKLAQVVADPALRDQLKPAAQDFYRAVASLAERSTLVERASADAALQEAQDTMSTIVSNKLLSTVISKGTKDWVVKGLGRGVAISGTIKSVSAVGQLTQYEVVMDGSTSKVNILTRIDSAAASPEIGSPVMVFGVIVDGPAENLRGYQGNSRKVVWATDLIMPRN